MSQFLNLFDHSSPPFKNAVPINFLKSNVPKNRPRETDAAQQPYFTGEDTGAQTSWHS